MELAPVELKLGELCIAVDESEKAAIGNRRVRRREGCDDLSCTSASSSVSGSGEGGRVSIISRQSRQAAWKPPCSQVSSPSKPSSLNLRRRPVMLEDSPATCESASYTRILEAEGHAKKRVRALVDGSMSARRCREKRGLLRSVEGTERGIAWGIRADEYAACGRMSRMRVFRSSTLCVSDDGRIELNDINDGKQQLFITSSTLVYSSTNMDPSSSSSSSSSEDSTSTYFLAAPRATRLRGGPLGRSS